jgi:putative glycosyltransferase (TIGR04372 family)
MKILLHAIYLPLAIVLTIFRIKFPGFFITRIGHLLVEPDCLLKEQMLDRIPKFRIVMLASNRHVANTEVARLWKRYLHVVQSRWLCYLLRPLITHPLTRYDVTPYANALDGDIGFPEIQSCWGSRAPLLKLDASKLAAGEDLLVKLGVPKGAWFVCVHNRSGAYSPADESRQGHRNNSMDSYLPSIKWIRSMGGFCIRIGVKETAEVGSLDGLIDYPGSPYQSPVADLYLCSRARFFIGNTSGAFLMSSIFGVPVVCSDRIPMGSVFPYGSLDIGIPKLYREANSGRLLKVIELVELGLFSAKHSDNYKLEGLVIENNSPDDILDAVKEQYDRTSATGLDYSEEDNELQALFRSHFPVADFFRQSSSRIGRDFLKKYKDICV